MNIIFIMRKHAPEGWAAPWVRRAAHLIKSPVSCSNTKQDHNKEHQYYHIQEGKQWLQLNLDRVLHGRCFSSRMSLTDFQAVSLSSSYPQGILELSRKVSLESGKRSLSPEYLYQTINICTSPWCHKSRWRSKQCTWSLDLLLMRNIHLTINYLHGK